MDLWEILVPTKFQDNGNPVRTKHHKEWDRYVISISGGLTILKPARGSWVSSDKNLYEDRVIPVRIACTENQILKIMEFTKRHYRQLSVMAYKISNEVLFI